MMVDGSRTLAKESTDASIIANHALIASKTRFRRWRGGIRICAHRICRGRDSWRLLNTRDCREGPEIRLIRMCEREPFTFGLDGCDEARYHREKSISSDF